MLTVGDKFPDITVPVQQGISALPAGETINVLTTAPGMWKIVFYWPKDFTFVCPTEIVGYAALKDDFADRDAVLIGASTDTSHVHLAWRKSDPDLEAADFPWLADNGKALANALGIVDADAQVAYRATFTVDPDNVIQAVQVNGLNVGRNPQETLRVLDALQSDELCPCNWNKGEETLHPVAA